MTKSVRSQLADRLYAHEWDDGKCKCGWKPLPNAAHRFGRDHCDHVADVLVGEYTFNDTRKRSNTTMQQTPNLPSAYEDEDWGEEVWDALSTLVAAGVTPELYDRWTCE